MRIFSFIVIDIPSLSLSLFPFRLLLLLFKWFLGQAVLGATHALRPIHVETEDAALQLSGLVGHNAVHLLQLRHGEPGWIRVLHHLDAAQTVNWGVAKGLSVVWIGLASSWILVWDI